MKGIIRIYKNDELIYCENTSKNVGLEDISVLHKSKKSEKIEVALK